jgi:hypothetical protein
MINKSLTEVCTERVEQLSFDFIKRIFNQPGMEQPSLEECRIILTRDFKNIMHKLSVFSKLRHRGRHGLLGKSLQRKLNLKLLIMDILKQSVMKKRALVKEIIKENDRLLIEHHHSEFKSRILVKTLDDHRSSNINIDQFLKKAERLYFLQKTELRKSTLDNQIYDENLAELEQIYKQHLTAIIRDINNP